MSGKYKMLRELDYLPPGLIEQDATQLQSLLDGPTLIHLKGRQEPAILFSVLMHGNETTGWLAVRELLQQHSLGQALPRTLSLFIGNVAAAARGLRQLDEGVDYNRIWPGCEGSQDRPEHAMMRQIVDIMQRRGVFASVDIHNNTGTNPHYACVNWIDNRFLHLATLFSRTVVYFLRPCGVQSMAMAKLCPAVTLECGRPGQPHGTEHALDYLKACLHLSEHPEHPVAHHDIDLFHSVATVKIPAELSFGFGQEPTDIQFIEDLDYLNFRELPRGTPLGRISPDKGVGLIVSNERGKDVTSHYFTVEDGELKLRAPVMPSMLTKDHRVVRQDCLGYLMERYNDHLPSV